MEVLELFQKNKNLILNIAIIILAFIIAAKIYQKQIRVFSGLSPAVYIGQISDFIFRNR